MLQQKLGPLQREQDTLLRHRDTHRETAQREEAAEDEKGRAMQRDVDQLRAVNGKISKCVNLLSAFLILNVFTFLLGSEDEDRTKKCALTDLDLRILQSLAHL